MISVIAIAHNASYIRTVVLGVRHIIIQLNYLVGFEGRRIPINWSLQCCEYSISIRYPNLLDLWDILTVLVPYGLMKE